MQTDLIQNKPFLFKNAVLASLGIVLASICWADEKLNSGPSCPPGLLKPVWAQPQSNSYRFRRFESELPAAQGSIYFRFPKFAEEFKALAESDFWSRPELQGLSQVGQVYEALFKYRIQMSRTLKSMASRFNHEPLPKKF